METGFTVHGAAGSGSAGIEAALTLIGLPYQITRRAAWKDPGAARTLQGPD